MVTVSQTHIENAQGIPHAALSCAGDHHQCPVGNNGSALVGCFLQPSGNFRCGQAAEIKTLAAAQNGLGKLLRLSSGQDEYHMGRWLFQCFQKRVECGGRQHMDFVHNIYFIPAELGRIFDRITQVAHFIHTVVAGGVDFNDIQAFLVIHPKAVAAFAARVAIDGMFAVDRFGKNLGSGGFAGSAGTAEQICMGNTVMHNLIPQGFNNSLLPDNVREILWPPLAVQSTVWHDSDSSLAEIQQFTELFQLFHSDSLHGGQIFRIMEIPVGQTLGDDQL